MTFLDRIAQEMHAEALCIGLVKSSWSWPFLDEDTKEHWRMIATAAVFAMREEVGASTVDRLLAPEREKA